MVGVALREGAGGGSVALVWRGKAYYHSSGHSNGKPTLSRSMAAVLWQVVPVRARSFFLAQKGGVKTAESQGKGSTPCDAESMYPP